MVWAKGRAWIGFRSGVLGIAVLLMIMSVGLGIAAAGTTHYIAANGSDSNNGTSKASPWLHAPGMPNCSGTCASYTPVAGDRFIFRGGDTWHFGNASGSPYAGGTWNIEFNGTAGNNIYFGADQAWFSGGSWTRPILTGDNAASTSTNLGACTYQVTGNSSSNDLISMGNSSYVTVDNFEMTGMCANGTSADSGFGWDVYLLGGASTDCLFEHLYIHGWTHQKFNYPTVQYSGFVFLGSSVGDNYQYNIVDGSDSDPGGWGQFYDAPYDASYNVFNYGSQGIGNNCHTFHDNLMENWILPGDGHAHGNVFECVGETTGTNLFYNNVFAHVYSSGGTGAIFWIGPGSGTTDYFFNNVIYDTVAAGNYSNIQSTGTGTVYAFNSTLQSSGGAALIECAAGSQTHAINMHFITDNATPYYNGTCSTVTNLHQSNSTANGQGYTGAETYAYSPASGSVSTVGTAPTSSRFAPRSVILMPRRAQLAKMIPDMPAATTAPIIQLAAHSGRQLLGPRPPHGPRKLQIRFTRCADPTHRARGFSQLTFSRSP